MQPEYEYKISYSKHNIKQNCEIKINISAESKNLRTV